MTAQTNNSNKAYQEVRNSAWYRAWKAVQCWYPHSRKMKSFYLFVDAFENNERQTVLTLSKRFKIKGGTYQNMLTAFDDLNDPGHLVDRLVADYAANPTYLPNEMKGKTK